MEDAKAIRIQQLRETLIVVSSEKAKLADFVDACQIKISQMETERVDKKQVLHQQFLRDDTFYILNLHGIESPCMHAGRQMFLSMLGSFTFQPSPG